ncbi:PREDICTED: transcription termination factor MTEF18, mitochondrial-like isoform X2 [Nelumbo nucifera]|uniref:Transcription termination factor MTEF18, mitochondrial-like isoform X2 n=1 Tax=Nelumbo nucifera TaxID=4432 RepID=A0A1U8AFN7_NELNU|nr:PREDICTED: transcription termination factor MTEF18, mitochondrial-like isoform X2 [Nelumbo nucifera]
MIVRQILRSITCISRMNLQFHCSWVSPVVSENSLNFGRVRFLCGSRPTHCPWVSSVDSLNLVNLQKIRFFCNSRPVNAGKISFPDPSCSTIVNRISRVARTEAQDALFDYLHCTRNLHFTDAEHISKNSPAFLQNLLSKVESEQEVSRSLSRFLRYNPINEFEPFFESLGLSPSELPSLLPRNLIFLSDDDIMLENYHVLCNYGIPRTKIGKIYKEAREIFAYDYGILASKLQAYEELGLSKATVIKLVICCPSLLIGNVNKEFAQILEKLKHLGIEQDWIRSYLLDNSIYNWKRMLNMICFLEEMGCCEKDMGRLFKMHPGFLLEDSGKKIYMLVALLLKLGLKMSEVLVLFLQYPQILGGNFAKNLWGAVHFMAEIGMETQDIAKIVSMQTLLLGSCSLKKPSTILKKLDMSKDRLCEIIKDDPRKLSSLASKSKLSSNEHAASMGRLHKLAAEDRKILLEKTSFLLRLGYVENSDEMMKALKKFRGKGDQLQERFDCLLNAGLDYHVVSNMVKVAPAVLNQTKDVIEKKIDYLVNHLGYPLKSVVAFPSYLCYDIERINLRFSMYLWLRRKGAAKRRVALSTILACSDARFVRYFVNLHPEGSAEWESQITLDS